MDQVSENHEAGLKSKGISEITYLEFFVFAFLGAYSLQYVLLHIFMIVFKHKVKKLTEQSFSIN